MKKLSFGEVLVTYHIPTGSRAESHSSLSLNTMLYLLPYTAFHTEKAMATHSSVLAWRIPGTGEPCGLPSMGSHRVGHD